MWFIRSRTGGVFIHIRPSKTSPLRPEMMKLQGLPLVQDGMRWNQWIGLPTCKLYKNGWKYYEIFQSVRHPTNSNWFTTLRHWKIQSLVNTGLFLTSLWHLKTVSGAWGARIPMKLFQRMRPRTCVGLHVVIEDSIRTGGRTWDFSVWGDVHGIPWDFHNWYIMGRIIYIYIIYI